MNFNSSSFTPSSFIGASFKGRDVSKKSKHCVLFRFLVNQQNTFGFRNARRIFEIGQSTIQITDLHGAVRAEYNSADIVSVKLGNDSDSIFILQFAKTAETFMCGKRAELLSALLPIIQKDEGAPLFEIAKWSKLQLYELSKRSKLDQIEDEPAQLFQRNFVWYKLWAGRLIILTDGKSQSTQSEICLKNVTKISAVSEDPAGAVIFLKHQRFVRFSCCEESESSSEIRLFAARDRFISALVDSAKVSFGTLIPVSETSNVEICAVFDDFHMNISGDAGQLIFSTPVRRYGRDFHKGKVKCRNIELFEKFIVERDCSPPYLIRRRLFLDQISYLIRPEDFTDVFGFHLDDQSTIWFSSEMRDCVLINILELSELNGVIITISSHEIPVSSKLMGSVELESSYEDLLLSERISSPSLKEDGAWREILDTLNANLSFPGASRCVSKKPLVALIQALTEVSTDPYGLNSTTCFGNSLCIDILSVLQKMAYARTCFEEGALLKKEGAWATLLALVQSSDDSLSFAAVTAIKAYTCYQPSKESLWKNEKYRASIEKVENINRSQLLDADMMTLLLGRLKMFANVVDSSKRTSTLLTVYAIMDLLYLVVHGSMWSSVGSQAAHTPSTIVLTNPQMLTISQVNSAFSCIRMLSANDAFRQHLADMMAVLCSLSRGPGLGIIRRASALQEWTLLTAPQAVEPGVPGGAQPGVHDGNARTGPVGGQAATAGQQQALQDLARGCGQVLWQLYLATAPGIAAAQRRVSGEAATKAVLLAAGEQAADSPLLPRSYRTLVAPRRGLFGPEKLCECLQPESRWLSDGGDEMVLTREPLVSRQPLVSLKLCCGRAKQRGRNAHDSAGWRRGKTRVL